MFDKLSLEYAEVLLDYYESVLYRGNYPEKNEAIKAITDRLISSVEDKNDKEAIKYWLGRFNDSIDKKSEIVLNIRGEILQIIKKCQNKRRELPKFEDVKEANSFFLKAGYYRLYISILKLIEYDLNVVYKREVPEEAPDIYFIELWNEFLTNGIPSLSLEKSSPAEILISMLMEEVKTKC
jgi:hypothetical protein